MIALRINGAEYAIRTLGQWQAGLAQLARMRVQIGTDVVYAYGIVYGYRRSGRLARRAGGTFSLPNAFAAVVPLVGPTLQRTIPQGAEAVRQGLLRLAFQIQGRTQAAEAVKTGNLRRSYHVVESSG